MKRNRNKSELLKVIRQSSQYAVIASLALLGSCSTESMYNMAQEVQLQRCEEQPIPVQENCKAQFEKSYDEYSRERAALTQEDQ